MTNAIAFDLNAAIAARAERDSKLATGGQTRSKSYLAYFASAAFATEAESYSINLHKFFDLWDKTLNRYELMMKALATGEFYLRNESDQNRYAFNIIKTMINAHNLKVAQVNKQDIFATGSKVSVETNEYVALSSRIMSDSTVARQTGIALYVLEALNVCEVQKVGKNIVGYKVNDKSVMYKKLAKMLKAEQAKQN